MPPLLHCNRHHYSKSTPVTVSRPKEYRGVQVCQVIVGRETPGGTYTSFGHDFRPFTEQVVIEQSNHCMKAYLPYQPHRQSHERRSPFFNNFSKTLKFADKSVSIKINFESSHNYRQLHQTITYLQSKLFSSTFTLFMKQKTTASLFLEFISNALTFLELYAAKTTTGQLLQQNIYIALAGST